MSQISADQVARAVIAAAGVYGIDPLSTFEAKGKQRRPLTAAAVALVAGRHATFDQAVRMLGLSGVGLRGALGRAAGGGSASAISAAAAAMKDALSKPRGGR